MKSILHKSTKTFAALLIVLSLNTIVLSNSSLFAQTGSNFNIGQKAVEKGIPYANATSVKPENFRQSFANIISSLLSVAMAFATLILLMMLIWGAMEWIMSGGDKSKVENARTRITQSILGIFVLASTVAIFSLVQQILNICVLNFGPFSCN